MPHDSDIEPFGVEISQWGSTVTVAVTGDLDMTTLPQLEAALGAVKPPRRLVLDLRDLAFMDSGGIRALMRLAGRSRSEGWSMAITCGPGGVKRLLDVCGVSERVPVVEDPSEVDR